MKVIMINNKIISLENVITVELHTSGSGAKSNPFRYWISVNYTNDMSATTPEFTEKKTAEAWLIKIFKILSKNT